MTESTHKVLMYSSPFCGYCSAAKRLLADKNVDFTEFNVMFDSEKRAEMTKRSGQTSVPQIFIGETHVGGFDDLYSLDKDGKLDALLAAVATHET